MKSILGIFLCCILLSSPDAFSKTYYVSPTGLTGNTGNSFSSPKDLKSAFALLIAGDSVLLRGGTYTIAYQAGTANTIILAQSGTASKMITVCAETNKIATLDFSFPQFTWIQDGYGILLTGSYWKFKGIKITRAGYQGAFVKGGYNIFEYCIFYDNRNSGIEINEGGHHTTLINVDSYHNYDPKKGGSMADGFAVKQLHGAGNKLIGCRSWDNSDDAYDTFDSPDFVVFDNCWAFNNGINIYADPNITFAGNGNGFKVGGLGRPQPNILRNCVSFGHPNKGFDQNSNTAGVTMLNCTSYNNGTNYGFGNTVNTGEKHIIKNCISLNGLVKISNSTQANNSWNSGFSVSSADFQSLVLSLATAARNPDGSIPETALFRLKSTSALVDAGANVGLPYNGVAPDLGAFETGTIVNTSPTVSLTTPSTGSSSCQGAAISLTATASDAGGSISKVEFFDGTALLGTSTSSPYTYSWLNAATGTHSITAKAIDNGNASTTSTAASFTINALPAATITAGGPTTFTQGGSVLLSANTGTGLTYRWLNGTSQVGTNATYIASTGGNYTIEVTNALGCKATSAAISVTVNPAGAPTVSITSPANNATFIAPASITFNATAADADGTVTKVDFYNGTTLLGTAATSPYSFTWTNVTAGTYTISAKATDNSSITTTSSPITILVNSSDVTIQAETACAIVGVLETKNAGFNGASYVNVDNAVGTTISWSINSTISQTVNLTLRYAGTSNRDMSLSVNGMTQATVNFPLTGAFTSWNTSVVQITLAAGTNSIVVSSLSIDGGPNIDELTFNSPNITLGSCGQAPTVSITSPANNATFSSLASVTINSTAADADGTITKVDFYNGITFLGTDASSPYSFTWTNVAVGTYTLTAVATNNGGSMTTSLPISITVNPAANQLPVVSLTSPANNNASCEGTAITLTASASDPDGTISKLEFFDGTTLLSTVTSSPYTYNWTNAVTGTHSVTVKATDNLSGTTTSTDVSITINQIPSAPTVATPVTYCQDATATALSASGTSLLWYTVSPNGISSATAPTPSTTAIGTTSYYVSQTVNGCESARAMIAFTVNAIPSVPTVTTPAPYCQNATATALTATGTALKWYTVPTNGISSATAPVPSTTTTGTTRYYVSQTTNGCESARAMIAVTVNSIPSAPNVSTPVTYCQNATAASLSANGTSLLWYTAPSGGTGSSTAPTPSTITTGTTSYYVSQTTSGCESARATIAVTVNAIPSAPGVSTPVTYCQNATVTALTASGTSLLWYIAPAGGTGSSLAPTPSTTATGTISYYVSQTTNGCEGTRAVIPVITNSAATATITAGGSTVFCKGGSVRLTANTGSSYIWMNGTTQVGTNATYTANTSGNYTVQITNPSGCTGQVTSSATVITVNPIPSAPGFTSAVSYCQNATASPLSATGTGLKWYTASSGGSSSSNAPTPSTTTVGTTNHYVSQTVNSCEGPRAMISVNINALPDSEITPSGPTTFVQGGSVTLNANTGSGLSYNWFNATTQVGTGPSYQATAVGNYTVEVTNASGCKNLSQAREVNVTTNQSSIITITSPTSNSTIIGSITITANVSDPDGGITLVEFLDGTTVIGTSTAAPYSFNWDNPVTGDHSITIRVTDSNGGVTISSPTTITSGTISGIQSSVGTMHGVVYPNPSNGEVYIDSDTDLSDASITVVDILGKDVAHSSIATVNGANVYISGLREGTYIIIIKQGNSILRKKITVKR